MPSSQEGFHPKALTEPAHPALANQGESGDIIISHGCLLGAKHSACVKLRSGKNRQSSVPVIMLSRHGIPHRGRTNCWLARRRRKAPHQRQGVERQLLQAAPRQAQERQRFRFHRDGLGYVITQLPRSHVR